jgi:hypothetical protein
LNVPLKRDHALASQFLHEINASVVFHNVGILYDRASDQ